ncbi:WD40-repeat-containing domain protein [Lipomyces japonicus]|uniref:WD40-repeat-containing domain protein n=1 Tax=Lipomyces japonicus TaxID=56871 RepID=UPI0034CE787F
MTEVPHLPLLATATTRLPPCVVQFYKPNSRFLLAGTYKLEDDGFRHGSIDIYDCNENDLNLVNSIPSADSSILDMKFSPHDSSLLATAHSTGKIVLWHARIGERGVLILNQLSSSPVAEADHVLVLAFTFSPNHASIISATLSSGELVLLDIDSADHSLNRRVCNKIHSLEAWVSDFNNDGTVVLTGGDDSLLSAFAIEPDTQVWSDRRTHAAGVTSILHFPGNDGQFWTGSYDDKLRSWSVTAKFARPELETEQDLGGGVWRLIPYRRQNGKFTVLACCMYGGARIIATNLKDTTKFSVVGTITQGHESMVYGGDWSSDGTILATCSFYDKQLKLWSFGYAF